MDTHNHDQDHGHHGHPQAEQNEIGPPVLFALICVVIAVLIIWVWAK